jgi:hypothetical protein
MRPQVSRAGLLAGASSSSEVKSEQKAGRQGSPGDCLVEVVQSGGGGQRELAWLDWPVERLTARIRTTNIGLIVSRRTE